ncbi:oxygen-insensitive NADPH nitroreductase [Gallibacterium salpingitidis]|uniref:Nitroreductase A n=1 Tax=Gallibacterium salpingitidis TaxID=505341 RepID=A0A1A7P1U2_9PAST|nr:oxygen-insensitive NADPH nitroreductase [Gallibacterium salpingitidis]OBW95968.1 nitroreductase A [Gallibacterium salpingitidis]
MSTEALEILHSHRSIRKFLDKEIDNETRQQLLQSARMASSSNHLQCVSIIRVTDKAMRQQLMQYCSNQEYVYTAPEFWVFCVDFAKHAEICPEAQLDWAEVLLIGAVDTGIMAQNVLASAELLGLGGVYIGSLRNEMEKVGELLQLPKHTLPIVGMCLGYPNQNPPLKPRLPAELMFFENHYQTLDQDKLAQFDQVTADYYQARSNIDNNWSKNVAKALNKPVRPAVLSYLQKQGFVKK